MTDSGSAATVAEFLYREARLLDTRKFGAWLDLFCDDAVFWVPAVGMNGEHTTEPETSLNFIYIVGRPGLEARVFRVESGGSLASNPLPHTRHLVTNVLVESDGPSEIHAVANTQVAAFCEPRGQQILNGSYEYVLRKENGSFRIARKKILLLEYVIDGYFDFFTV
ncbi:MAG: aromatic-ring-hydroxylating dioxygenase subunit beta [Xanthobacteraceae bacterium]|nr:aromatic-ring-hydroxylating dioxygenase subunit beta [Xanthobacteraceae bacterium]